MFTGIITGQGKVLSAAVKGGKEFQLELSAPESFNDAVIGESIAVNGVCLTVTLIKENRLMFYVSPETLERSNLGRLALNTRVNLERALKVGDRLSGHIVQGHIDTTAQIESIRPMSESMEIAIKLPSGAEKYITEKGSIAIDGISLTINSIDNSTIYLMIIPHTWKETNLSTKVVGDSVNIEYDMVLKHLARLVKIENR